MTVRLLRDTTPLQRGIIRHLVLVLDMSFAMTEKDLRPTRYLLTLRYAQEFVSEYFEQNPISQLGVVGMKNGIAVRVSEMSGNPHDHIAALDAYRVQVPKGRPSLQNALQMTRAALFNAPSHGTREALVIFGALLSSDPDDIHKTISALVADKIRVGVIGLAAQVAVCRELVARTNDGDDNGYGVVLNEQHFRELMMAITTPPVTQSQSSSASSLLMMGFPSRTVEPFPTLCACHSRPSRQGYLCTRCGTKVCSLPAECPTCGLTLILSTHLARSYHHLFPLMNWLEVPWRNATRSFDCYGCELPFPRVPRADQWAPGKEVKGMSVSSRYECPACNNHFCIDCDVFAHEVAHNCPGCQAFVSASVDRADHGDEDGTTEVSNGYV